MAGTTPIYGLPYPQSSDLVSAYPALGQDLAEDLDGILAAKAPTASPTFTGNVVWSGATLRAATAEVATQQTTSSTSYTDLATAGPAVTLTTGTKVLVIVSASVQAITDATSAFMSFAISGATTASAIDTWSLQSYGNGAYINVAASKVFLVTGLTAGSNTFTAKYKAGGNTAYFTNRSIHVIDMGS